MKDIKDVCCPDCGAKDFEDLGSSTTLLGRIPRYVNGKLVSKNPNHTTTGFKCYKCGKIWYETDVTFIASDINEIDC